MFKNHILCCFINDRIGVKLLDEFNVDNLCWESDYPHSDGTWPQAPEYVAKLMGELPKDVVAKITHQNAIAPLRVRPLRPPPAGENAPPRLCEPSRPTWTW